MTGRGVQYRGGEDRCWGGGRNSVPCEGQANDAAGLLTCSACGYAGDEWWEPCERASGVLRLSSRRLSQRPWLSIPRIIRAGVDEVQLSRVNQPPGRRAASLLASFDVPPRLSRLLESFDDDVEFRHGASRSNDTRAIEWLSERWMEGWKGGDQGAGDVVELRA